MLLSLWLEKYQLNKIKMVIHNHIFDSYRIQQKKLNDAKALLKANGYVVVKVKEKENI